MIKNIIFDLGDVFINLNKEAFSQETEKFKKNPEFKNKLLTLNKSLEVGKISGDEFIDSLIRIYPNSSKAKITDYWNSMLADIPKYRLDFIEKLAIENKYRLFLLSNTNGIHINCIMNKLGLKEFNRFKNCFEQFYLSHEIKLRKPSKEIYEYVLSQSNLTAGNTLFIDDSIENTKAAENIGIKCWNLQVGKEDVIQLQSYINTF